MVSKSLHDVRSLPSDGTTFNRMAILVGASDYVEERAAASPKKAVTSPYKRRKEVVMMAAREELACDEMDCKGGHSDKMMIQIQVAVIIVPLNRETPAEPCLVTLGNDSVFVINLPSKEMLHIKFTVDVFYCQKFQASPATVATEDTVTSQKLQNSSG